MVEIKTKWNSPASNDRAAAGGALLLKRWAVAQANAIDKTICKKVISLWHYNSFDYNHTALANVWAEWLI